MKAQIETKYNLKVIEREIGIKEVINSSKEGRLFEVFGASPHCHLMPFNRIVYQDTTVQMEGGDLCETLSREINNVMRGDPSNDWITAFE